MAEAQRRTERRPRMHIQILVHSFQGPNIVDDAVLECEADRDGQVYCYSPCTSLSVACDGPGCSGSRCGQCLATAWLAFKSCLVRKRFARSLQTCTRLRRTRCKTFSLVLNLVSSHSIFTLIWYWAFDVAPVEPAHVSGRI